MKIISWNVNGIEAVMQKNNMAFIKAIAPDFIFFQNLKTSLPPQVNISPRLNYRPLLNLSCSASKENSGTMSLARVEDIEYDFVQEVDKKSYGQIIEIRYKNVCFINFVSEVGKVDTQNQRDKIDFYKGLIHHLEVRKQEGFEIIVGGDFQIAFKEGDLSNPNTNKGYSGFHPEELEMVEIMEQDGFVDVFRALHPDKMDNFTYWPDRMDARRKNKGWRFDYFLISKSLLPKVKECIHLTKVEGSNHCPILLDIEI